MTREQAAALVRRETCTWSCLLAREPVCVCRCTGDFHGAHTPPKPRYRVQPSRKLWVWLMELQRDDLDDEYRAQAAKFAARYIERESPAWKVDA